jgi:PAS domain S-box-containing protein
LKAIAAVHGISRHHGPAGAGASTWLPTLGWALAIGSGYFLAARLGLALLSASSDVAVFWPASGVAAGILITFGRRARAAVVLGVLAGTLAANLLGDRTIATSLFKAFCNAGEAVLMAWLLECWFGPAFTFSDLRGALGFLAAAVLATAISAVGGAVTMTLFHTTAPFLDVWRTWFLSDLIGIIVTGPLVIGIGLLWQEPPSQRELMAGVGVIALMALLAAYMVTHPTNSWLSFSPGCVELPALFWLAARYPPTLAIAAAFVLSIFVICATVLGIGHFGDPAIPIMERVQGAQLTVAMVTAFTLVIVALFAERRQKEAALQLALAGANLGAFSADLISGRMEFDPRATKFHGHDVPPTTIDESRRFVCRDDLPRIDAALAEARRTGTPWNAEYRVIPPPNHPYHGQTRWVAVESSLIRNAQGAPVRLLGVTRDITAKKQTEQVIVERKAQLELASKVARVGTFTVDFAARSVRLSPGCATLYGFPEGSEEISLEAAWASVHQDDRACLEALTHRLRREQKSDFVAQFRIARPDTGEIRWIEVRSLVAYDNDRCPSLITGASIDVTERKHDEDHKNLLISELDHRVKNTLACVNGIVEQTRASSSSFDNFLDSLKGRIRSLAETHALLSVNGWHAVALGELVHRELAPCMRNDNTLIEGPAVGVTADSVQPIAIVLHELATNAAKHGALSNNSGRVSVRWAWQLNGGSHELLALEWRETGGPLISAQAGAGYGTTVIRELIPYELGGRVDYALAADGVRCNLQIPARWLDRSASQGGSAGATRAEVG